MDNLPSPRSVQTMMARCKSSLLRPLADAGGHLIFHGTDWTQTLRPVSEEEIKQTGELEQTSDHVNFEIGFRDPIHHQTTRPGPQGQPNVAWTVAHRPQASRTGFLGRLGNLISTCTLLNISSPPRSLGNCATHDSTNTFQDEHRQHERNRLCSSTAVLSGFGPLLPSRR